MLLSEWVSERVKKKKKEENSSIEQTIRLVLKWLKNGGKRTIRQECVVNLRKAKTVKEWKQKKKKKRKWTTCTYLCLLLIFFSSQENTLSLSHTPFNLIVSMCSFAFHFKVLSRSDIIQSCCHSFVLHRSSIWSEKEQKKKKFIQRQMTVEQPPRVAMNLLFPILFLTLFFFFLFILLLQH